MWNGFQSSFLRTHLNEFLVNFFLFLVDQRLRFNMAYFVFDQINE